MSTAVIGVTLGPMEAAHGRYLSDTPTWYRTLAWVLGASHLLWAALGITGLVMGILALSRRSGHPSTGGPGAGRTGGGTSAGGTTGAVAAIVLAVLGPVLVVGVFMVALLVGAAAAGA